MYLHLRFEGLLHGYVQAIAAAHAEQEEQVRGITRETIRCEVDGRKLQEQGDQLALVLDTLVHDKENVNAHALAIATQSEAHEVRLLQPDYHRNISTNLPLRDDAISVQLYEYQIIWQLFRVVVSTSPLGGSLGEFTLGKKVHSWEELLPIYVEVVLMTCQTTMSLPENRDE
jgi:hypothetical protein